MYLQYEFLLVEGKQCEKGCYGSEKREDTRYKPGLRCRVRCLQLLSATARARILGKVDSVFASLSFSGFCFLTLQSLSNVVTECPYSVPATSSQEKEEATGTQCAQVKDREQGWKPTGLGS